LSRTRGPTPIVPLDRESTFERSGECYLSLVQTEYSQLGESAAFVREWTVMRDVELLQRPLMHDDSQIVIHRETRLVEKNEKRYK
jgi:hypothetical protein